MLLADLARHAVVGAGVNGASMVLARRGVKPGASSPAQVTPSRERSDSVLLGRESNLEDSINGGTIF